MEHEIINYTPYWYPIIPVLIGGLLSLSGMLISQLFQFRIEANKRYSDHYLTKVIPYLIKPLIKQSYQVIEPDTLNFRGIIETIENNVEYIPFCPPLVQTCLFKILELDYVDINLSEKNRRALDLLVKIREETFCSIKKLT